eukprot:364508-Chlamydomonas_euryale.AAC.2
MASDPTRCPAGEEVFLHVTENSKTLCAGASEAPRPPNSWSDALAMVQAREEAERKKKDTRRDKSKQSKSGLLAGDPAIHPPPPGTLIGDPNTQSVFWLFMEVCMSTCMGRRTVLPASGSVHEACSKQRHDPTGGDIVQDYFRDLTPEDFQLLLPTVMDASQDDALTVPFLGCEKLADEKHSRGMRREEHEVRLLACSLPGRNPWNSTQRTTPSLTALPGISDGLKCFQYPRERATKLKR